jgi:predicted RNA methylase
VDAIADNIPLGQPILVGHHSEKRARRDAARIENGMRKAVGCWEASKYWKDRAAGAVRHAKYLERPDVRARRIKKLESERRKVVKTKESSARFLAFWSAPNLDMQTAKVACGRSDAGWLALPRKEGDNPTFSQSPSAYDVLGESRFPHLYVARTLDEVVAVAVLTFTRSVERCDRWIVHYDNRLEYERAMQAACGGTVADKTGPEVGGACRCWASPGFGRGWSYIVKVNKVSVTIREKAEYGEKTYTRTMPFDKLKAVMTKAEVDAAKEAGRIHECEAATGFFLDQPVETMREAAQKLHEEAVASAACQADDEGERFSKLREALDAGVKTVTVPNLFPTPFEVAQQMAELAEIEITHRVLEPSAGTGVLMSAIRDRLPAEMVAVEINVAAADILKAQAAAGGYGPYSKVDVRCADFLECTAESLGGPFDRVLMNPPFDHGTDVAHVLHAMDVCKEGGRIVAIVAAGPRQRETFEKIATAWIDLPPGTFKEAGTMVNTAIVLIDV